MLLLVGASVASVNSIPLTYQFGIFLVAEVNESVYSIIICLLLYFFAEREVP